MIIERLRKVLGAYGAVARIPGCFPLRLCQLVSNLGDTFHYIDLVVIDRFSRKSMLLGVPGCILFGAYDFRKHPEGALP